MYTKSSLPLHLQPIWFGRGIDAEKITLKGVEARLSVAKPGAACEENAIAICDKLHVPQKLMIKN